MNNEGINRVHGLMGKFKFTHQPMYAINPLIIHIVLMIVIMHVEVK